MIFDNAAEFLDSQCADLTPYLSGDAVKEYPNLAAIPTFAWKNSGCAYNGKIYMWPVERYRPLNMLFDPEHALDDRIAREQFAV